MVIWKCLEQAIPANEDALGQTAQQQDTTEWHDISSIPDSQGTPLDRDYDGDSSEHDSQDTIPYYVEDLYHYMSKDLKEAASRSPDETGADGSLRIPEFS